MTSLLCFRYVKDQVQVDYLSSKHLEEAVVLINELMTICSLLRTVTVKQKVPLTQSDWLSFIGAIKECSKACIEIFICDTELTFLVTSFCYGVAQFDRVQLIQQVYIGSMPCASLLSARRHSF